MKYMLRAIDMGHISRGSLPMYALSAMWNQKGVTFLHQNSQI